MQRPTILPGDAVEQARARMREHQPDISLGRRRCITCGEKWDRLFKPSGCTPYRRDEDIVLAHSAPPSQSLPHTGTGSGDVDARRVGKARHAFGGYHAA